MKKFAVFASRKFSQFIRIHVSESGKRLATVFNIQARFRYIDYPVAYVKGNYTMVKKIAKRDYWFHLRA